MTKFQISALLFASGFAISSYEAEAATCTVTARVLNVRQDADRTSASLDTIDNGGTITCDPSKKDNGFIKVTLPSGTPGWMSLNYLTVATGETRIKAGDGGFVNIRSKPTSDSSDIGDLKGNLSYPVSNTSKCKGTSRWYAINMGEGKCGYVSKRFSDSYTAEPTDNGGNDGGNGGEIALIETTEPNVEVTEPVVAILPDQPQAGPGDSLPVTQTDPFAVAANYKIRTAEGMEMCTIGKGSKVTPLAISDDGSRVKVRFDSPNCPGFSEGWMGIHGIRTQDLAGKVDVEGSLALRDLPEGKATCDIPNNAKLKILGEKSPTDTYRAWVKVQVVNPPPGCPAEGWVNREYLSPDSALIDNLPVEQGVWTNDPEAAVPEGCDGTCGQTIKDLKDVVNGVRRLDDITTWKKTRGNLVAIPLKGEEGTIGPCGSYHYNPDHRNPSNRSEVTDNYADPLTACAFMAFLQAWKAQQDKKLAKEKGPSYRRDGSRLEWSDISDKRDAYWDGHKQHTDGNCIDIRPSRKTYDEKHPLIQYNYSNYDQEKTREMIKLAKEMGGYPVYFNDPGLCTGEDRICNTSSDAHKNHIHICFGGAHSNDANRKKVKEACDTYQYDANICGGL